MSPPPSPESLPQSKKAAPDQVAETDIIDEKGRKKTRGTERRCIVTRQAADTSELIRFVVGPDGTLMADLKARLPGRGAWVTARAERVAEAAQKGHFARALKAPIKAPQDLDRIVGNRLEELALDALGMAGGQGAIETGHSKVDAGARSQRYGLILFASDGAPGSLKKLLSARYAGGAPAPLIYSGFTSDQISLSLGRANVIHAGLVTGRVAASVTRTLRRLDDYLSGGALQDPGV